MSEPLTAEEETRWRALLDADTSPMPSWSRESMLRIWATLDAARTPSQPDLREALRGIEACIAHGHYPSIEDIGSDNCTGCRSLAQPAPAAVREPEGTDGE